MEKLESSVPVADSVEMNPETLPSSKEGPIRHALRSERNALDSIFNPASVALIGATEREGSVGRAVLGNLKAAFPGKIYPVNPKNPQILGLPAYSAIGKVPDKVDLAVIVTPAGTVPGIIQDCIKVGVKSAVVISAGFKEHGAEGKLLEQKISDLLRSSDLRLIGPNCLGVMNPLAGLTS